MKQSSLLLFNMNINNWISCILLLVILTCLDPIHGGNCLYTPSGSGMLCTCCKPGFGGFNCTILCPNCETRLMLGNVCRETCTDGYYGEMCDIPCSRNCMEGIFGKKICDKKDGTCDNECIPGYFGLRCDLVCNSNCHKKECLQKDGTCNSCKENRYHGNQCSEPCNEGCFNGTCEMNGKCIGECKDGYFGETCGYFCGQNCNNSRCFADMRNRFICTDGCNDGYTSKSCSIQCPGYCSICHQDSERCISCMPDYIERCQNGDCETGIVTCEPRGDAKIMHIEHRPAWVLIFVSVVVTIVVVIAIFCIIRIFVRRRFIRNIPPAEYNVSADSPLIELTVDTSSNRDTANLSYHQESRGVSVRRRKNTDRNDENERQNLIEALHVKTKSEVEIRTKDMLQTSFKEIILGKINHGQRWITVTGRPGEGKSIAAFMALKELQDKGRHVFQVKLPEEFSAVLTSYFRPVILLNKIFGDWGREQTAYTKWKDVLIRYCNDNNVRRYEKDIDITGNIGTTIMLVEHDYCLEPALQYLETLREFITRDSHLLDMSKQDVLTFEDRTNICLTILKPDKKGKDRDKLRDICNIQGKLAFPQMCRLFEILRRVNSNISAVAYFRSPLYFLNESVNTFMEAETNDLFKKMITQDGRIRADLASENANKLVGRYLREENGYFMFLNLSIYDSFELNICKMDPLYVIKNCSLSVLQKRFILLSHPAAQINQSDEHVYISAKSEHAEALAKRFAFEIEMKNLRVLSHNACSNKWFISEMMKQCKLKMHEITGLTDRFSKESFLILVASNKSSKLLEYFEHETGICQSPRNTSLLLLGVCKYAASEVLDYLCRKCKLDIDVKLDDKWRTPLMIAAETKDSDFVNKIMSFSPDFNTADTDGATVLHYLCRNGLEVAAEEAIAKGVNIDVTDNLGLSPLHYADRVNEMDVVKLLLNKGAKPDSRLIGAACRIWDINIVKLLFEGHEDVNMRLGSGYTPLLSACAGGNVAVINFLIESGASVNKYKDLDRSPLHVAASHCKPDAVAALLQRGADVSVMDRAGEMPLHYAAEAGSRECVVKLLHTNFKHQFKGARSIKIDVNAKSIKGYTPLHKAAMSRSNDCVKELLKANTNVHDITNNGLTPLHIAAEKGSSKCVKSLIDARAKVNTHCHSNYTPLHDAAKWGFTETVKVLLQAGADVTAKNKHGQTALHKASELRSKDCLALLIDSKSEVNARTKIDETPLHYATKNGSEECIAALLEAGADVNLGDQVGSQPVHTAAKLGSKQCLKLLLEARADANAQDTQGETPLHKAALVGSKTCIDYLLQHSANVNIPNNLIETPLHQSIASGSKECSITLIEAKSNVNAQNAKGDTPLLIALRHDEPLTLVVLLLNAGADVNTQSYDSVAPLHVAAELGLTECLNILITRESEINIRNANRDTPLHLAVLNNRKECVLYLLKAGADTNIENKSSFSPHDIARQNSNEELQNLLIQ